LELAHQDRKLWQEGRLDEMSISSISKLAIAFIRPFRSYIDGYNLFRSEYKSQVEAEIRSKIEDITEAARSIDPNIDEEKLKYTKECLISINMKLMENYNKNYSGVLAEILEKLTLELEAEIRNSFNIEEQQKLVELVSDPLFQKILQNEKLFGLLKKSELDLEYKLRQKTSLDISSSNGIEEIKNLIRDLKKKPNQTDEEENDDFDFPDNQDSQDSQDDKDQFWD
jgi:hypothetical protein